ncbi:MAG: hypothetical protein ACT452_20425 [Microthrixaceae bacterium]
MRATPRAMRRAAFAAALLAGAVAALASPSNASSSERSSSERTSSVAAAAGPCADTEGVTVVVDFGTLAGGTQTRCAPEPVSSGFDALTRAGFTYAGTARFPGLLCRIDDKPSPEQDACQNAPSPKYYWAYWTASSPGGAWTYSDMGAGNRDPAPGSVEGWAFSDGCTRKPGASTNCSSVTTTASPTTSPPTTSPPTASGGGKASGGSSGTPGSTVAVAPSDALNASDGSSTGDTTTIDGDALPSAGHDDDHADDLDLDDRRDAVASGPAEPDSGSPAGVIAGAVVAGALGLAAARQLRQRRRATLAGSAGE